ncbi:MAG: hypothetical protein IPM29_20510 [Planctomycetes bacterium]|nr:hypothetical protein [Planctomycetota bacterium]
MRTRPSAASTRGAGPLAVLSPVLACLLAGSPAAAPQEPRTLAESVRTSLDRVSLGTDARAIEERLAAVRAGRVPGVAQPGIVGRVRSAGLDALGVGQLWAVLDDGDDADLVAMSFAQARAAWGFRGREVRIARRPDVDDLIGAIEDCRQELTSALGSGRRLQDVAAWLLTTIDTLRTERSNLGELTVADEKELRERFDRLTEVDQETLLREAETLTRLALALDRPELLASWKRKPVRSARSDGAVQGDVLIDRDSSVGRVVVGGFGRNVYDASQIAVIIDLGGDDEYRGAVAGAGEWREFAMVVDFDGNDEYAAESEGLGAAVFGVGVLVDCRGNDTYTARTRSAGFGTAGVGVFVDLGGDDTYELGQESCGAGLAGTGIWIDASGNDVQKAGAQSFGVGLPGGVAIAWDNAGDDERVVGRERRRLVDASAGTTSGAGEEVSAGFGVGIGALPILSGGFGAFVDASGKDRYEAAGIAFGVGLRGGVGMFQDRAGDDTYRGLDGCFGVGYAAGIGLFYDVAGDDGYEAHRLAFGGAELDGLGAFVESAGADRYQGAWPAFGVGRRGGLGVFLERGGLDAYLLGGASADWRLAATGVVRGPGIGLMLDTRGPGDDDGADTFDFVGIDAPVRGALRVDVRGEGDDVEKQAILVR